MHFTSCLLGPPFRPPPCAPPRVIADQETHALSTAPAWFPFPTLSAPNRRISCKPRVYSTRLYPSTTYPLAPLFYALPFTDSKCHAFLGSCWSMRRIWRTSFLLPAVSRFLTVSTAASAALGLFPFKLFYIPTILIVIVQLVP